MNFDQIRTIHFVGIGGIGMSGVAGILSDSGVSVSGCDVKHFAGPELMESRGLTVSIGHDPAHLDGVDLVVVTAAVKGENAELEAARRRGIPVMRRAEMLGEIVAHKRAVGVSGTHGKTTTSAMIATILESAGLDPTHLVGGIVRNFDTNAKSGHGEYLVVEADEYDRTFHHLHPEIAVVTNIEVEHLEYYGSFDAIVEAFRLFVDGIAENGVVVGCVDEAPVAALLNHTHHRIVRYGLGPDAELTATNLQFHERGSSFEVPGVGFFKL